MNKNPIGLTTEAHGLPEIAPSALHMAERDGLMAALRMLHTPRWHLDGHEHPEHGKQAAAAFADSFFGVLRPCLLDVMTAPRHGAVDVFMGSLIEQCPALMAELERGLE